MFAVKDVRVGSLHSQPPINGVLAFRSGRLCEMDTNKKITMFHCLHLQYTFSGFSPASCILERSNLSKVFYEQNISISRARIKIKSNKSLKINCFGFLPLLKVRKR